MLPVLGGMKEAVDAHVKNRLRPRGKEQRPGEKVREMHRGNWGRSLGNEQGAEDGLT